MQGVPTLHVSLLRQRLFELDVVQQLEELPVVFKQCRRDQLKQVVEGTNDLGPLLTEVESSLLVSQGDSIKKSRALFFIQPVDVDIIAQEVSAKV